MGCWGITIVIVTHPVGPWVSVQHLWDTAIPWAMLLGWPKWCKAFGKGTSIQIVFILQKKRQKIPRPSILCPATLSWSFAWTVADWNMCHSRASGVPSLPDHKLSHPQKRLTSARTAMTTPVTMILTGGTMATAVIDTHVVSEIRPNLLCKCLYQLCWRIAFEPDWHCLMENK